MHDPNRPAAALGLRRSFIAGKGALNTFQQPVHPIQRISPHLLFLCQLATQLVGVLNTMPESRHLLMETSILVAEAFHFHEQGFHSLFQ